MGSQPQLQEYVKDIYKTDDYTVEMELPNRIQDA